MKIVYCTDSICYLGGIQRITIAKASALADVPGNEVWIVVTDNRKDVVLPISSKVHVIDLRINYFEDDWKGKLYILKGILYKRRLHKRRLTIVLEQIQPDIVIATGTSEKNFLPSIRLSTKPIFIREIHSFKYYRISSANNWFSKLLAIIGDFVDYKLQINHYDKIVVLSGEDKANNWNNDPRISVIPNPLTTLTGKRCSYKRKTVIAAGRLSYPKNFASLIRIWKSIYNRYPDWILEIWGSGDLYNDLQKQINSLGLQESAFLKGYSSDILTQMANASIYALTSKYEGFSLAIIEAMSVGLPIVAYQCACGPKDIILDSCDGFLIPPDDEIMFADRLSLLMDDYDLRERMGNNALIKSQEYHIEHIAQMWMQLFTELKAKK